MLQQRFVIPEMSLAQTAMRAGVVSGRLLEILLKRAASLERLLAGVAARHFAADVERVDGVAVAKVLSDLM